MAMRAFRQTLAGLPGVSVQVEPISADAERHGLAREDLQALVEERLRQADIRLYSRAALFSAAPGTPVLRMDVATIRLDAHYAYAIRLELWQGVRLDREPEVRALGVTWMAATVAGAVGAADLATVRNAVEVAVDEFVADHRAANAAD